MIYFILAYYQEKQSNIKSLQDTLTKEGHQVRIVGRDPHTLTHLGFEIRTEKLDAHLVLMPPAYADIPALLENIAQTFAPRRPPITLVVDYPEKVSPDALAILPEIQVLTYEEFESNHKVQAVPANRIRTTFGELRKHSLFTVENDYSVMVKTTKKTAVPLYRTSFASVPVTLASDTPVLISTKPPGRVQYIALSGYLLAAWTKKQQQQIEKLSNPDPDSGHQGKQDEQL